MLFFSVGNGAMNASRYWQLHDDGCSAVGTIANTPCFSYPYGAMISWSRWQIANSCTIGA
jgi:hypothetical protein